MTDTTPLNIPCLLLSKTDAHARALNHLLGVRMFKDEEVIGYFSGHRALMEIVHQIAGTGQAKARLCRMDDPVKNHWHVQLNGHDFLFGQLTLATDPDHPGMVYFTGAGMESQSPRLSPDQALRLMDTKL